MKLYEIIWIYNTSGIKILGGHKLFHFFSSYFNLFGHDQDRKKVYAMQVGSRA